MLMKSLNRKAQATTELAILGALILVGFSWVMNYGQSLRESQKARMEVFRLALSKSYERNASISYSLRRNKHFASIGGGYGQGRSGASGASASVMWQKGQAGTQGSHSGETEDDAGDDQSSFSYWQIDDSLPQQDIYGLPRVTKEVWGYDGSDSYVKTPVSVYKTSDTRIEDYNMLEDSIKRETKDGISISKHATLDDSIVGGQASTHYDTYVNKSPWDDATPSPVWADGQTISYDTGTRYEFSKSWYTPHDLNTPSTVNSSSTVSTTTAQSMNRFTSIQDWDRVYWGITWEQQQRVGEGRGQAYDCLSAGHPFYVTNTYNGTGYCDYNTYVRTDLSY